MDHLLVIYKDKNGDKGKNLLPLSPNHVIIKPQNLQIMRRLFLSLVVLCMTCMCAYAGLDIKVAQGDKKFMKTAEGKAVVEILWDGAQYDNKMPLEQKFDNLKECQAASLNGFKESLNDNSKKVKTVEDAKDATYKISIKITNVDQYFKVMGFVPGNATKIWGTLTISDAKSGDVLLVVDINEVDGGASPSPIETFSDSFEELAEQLTKLK